VFIIDNYIFYIWVIRKAVTTSDFVVEKFLFKIIKIFRARSRAKTFK